VHWLPAAPELEIFLENLDQTSPFIAVRYNGEPWESEEQLQKQSSNFIAKLKKKGVIGEGLTLHGLRATFAAEIKRVTGANDDQVAAALGDRDARMGAHYTRHVEQETRSSSSTPRCSGEQEQNKIWKNRSAQNGKPLPAPTKTAKLLNRLRGPKKKKGGPCEGPPSKDGPADRVARATTPSLPAP
jgi:hypothetical protein